MHGQGKIINMGPSSTLRLKKMMRYLQLLIGAITYSRIEKLGDLSSYDLKFTLELTELCVTLYINVVLREDS